MTHNIGCYCKRKRFKRPGTACKAKKNFTEDSDKAPFVYEKPEVSFSLTHRLSPCPPPLPPPPFFSRYGECSWCRDDHCLHVDLSHLHRLHVLRLVLSPSAPAQRQDGEGTVTVCSTSKQNVLASNPFPGRLPRFYLAVNKIATKC